LGSQNKNQLKPVPLTELRIGAEFRRLRTRPGELALEFPRQSPPHSPALGVLPNATRPSQTQFQTRHARRREKPLDFKGPSRPSEESEPRLGHSLHENGEAREENSARGRLLRYHGRSSRRTAALRHGGGGDRPRRHAAQEEEKLGVRVGCTESTRRRERVCVEKQER